MFFFLSSLDFTGPKAWYASGPLFSCVSLNWATCLSLWLTSVSFRTLYGVACCLELLTWLARPVVKVTNPLTRTVLRITNTTVTFDGARARKVRILVLPVPVPIPYIDIGHDLLTTFFQPPQRHCPFPMLPQNSSF